MSLRILEKTSTSIIYEMPPGKPDPSQACSIGEDTRERVFQSARKGGHCAYYAFNFLRDRIGKYPAPELEEKRAVEKACSDYRKSIDLFNKKMGCSLSDLHSSENQQRLALTKDEARSFIANNIGKKADDRCKLALTQMSEFIRDKRFTNFSDFLINRYCEGVTEICRTFSQRVGHDISKQLEDPDFQSWSICERGVVLLAEMRALQARLYGLSTSSWDPSKDIDSLIQELQVKGPLIVTARVGKTFYVDEPQEIAEQIQDRKVFGWKVGSQRSEKQNTVNSTLLVGARRMAEKAYVYYIDSLDPSDPKDKSVQKIYKISFDNLRRNILPLDGVSKEHSKAGYAYYREGIVKV